MLNIVNYLAQKNPTHTFLGHWVGGCGLHHLMDHTECKVIACTAPENVSALYLKLARL